MVSANPAADVDSPRVKPKPKEPFTRVEVSQMISACDGLGKRPYERLRARAMVLLLRCTALRISDVAQLSRDRVRGGQIRI